MNIRTHTWRKSKSTKAQKEYARKYYLKYRDECLQYARNWRRKNRKRHLVALRKWERKNLDYILLRGARVSAKKRGLKYNLTLEDIEIPKLCPVLGIPLKRGRYKRLPNSPSIDRVFPKLGYTKGNIRIISWRANLLKNDETDPEIFIKIAKYLRSNLSRRAQR